MQVRGGVLKMSARRYAQLGRLERWVKINFKLFFVGERSIYYPLEFSFRYSPWVIDNSERRFW